MNIDLNDLEVWGEAVPHDQFAWLRESDPVHFQTQPDGPGYWCLTKHEDIVKASKNFQGFSSGQGMHIRTPEDPAERAAVGERWLALEG